MGCRPFAVASLRCPRPSLATLAAPAVLWTAASVFAPFAASAQPAGGIAPEASAAPDPSQPYLLPAPDAPAPDRPPAQAPAPAASAQPAKDAPAHGSPVPAGPGPAAPASAVPATGPVPSVTDSSARMGGSRVGASAAVPPRPRPPARPPAAGPAVSLPGFSIRLDPLEMLLEGRLGPHLEVDLLGFLSVELVPLFFLTDSPIALDLGGFVGRDTQISQHSDGLGPLVGASLGAGVWLGGRAFEGYVLRLMFTNFGVTYRSEDGGERVDSLDFVERRVQVLLESMGRIGIFTYGGGMGIGYELNPSDRCDLSENGPGFGFNAGSSGCGELQLAVRDAGSIGSVDLLGPLGRWSLVGRLYVGVTID